MFIFFLWTGSTEGTNPNSYPQSNTDKNPYKYTYFYTNNNTTECATGNEIRILETERYLETSKLLGHNEYVWKISFSPDGELLASTSWDKTVKLWEVETGKELTSFSVPDKGFSIAFSADGKSLAAGFLGEQPIKIWEIDTGLELASLTGCVETVWSLSFSPDGEMLSAGCGEGDIVIWNLEDDYTQEKLYGHKDRRVSNIVFSPEHNFILSVGSKPEIIFWGIPKWDEEVIPNLMP